MAARTRATCRALMHVRVSTNGALALPRWGTGESLGGRLHPQPDPQPPVRSPVVGVVLYVRSVKPACIPARCYPGARATGRLRGQPPRRAERCPIRASESMLDLTFISAHARHTTSVPVLDPRPPVRRAHGRAAAAASAYRAVLLKRRID